VVRPVIPPPIIPSSSTTTERPSLPSRKAVVNPAIPAPMMQISVRMLSFSGDGDGVFAVAIQMDVVACESSFMIVK
jgi:hypothetical protein